MASRPTRMHLKIGKGVPRCETRKFGYRSRDEALRDAEIVMQRGDVKPGCHIAPYECERCGEWHLWNRRIV